MLVSKKSNSPIIKIAIDGQLRMGDPKRRSR